MIRVHDGLFDYRYLSELSYQLSISPWYPGNVANRMTYPYGDRGTHRLLGNTIFYREGLNHIITKGDPHLVRNLQNCFTNFLEKFEQERELIEIHLNLQFKGMNGTIHQDGGDNETAYIMMLTDDEVEKDSGGEFYHQPTNEYVEFKQGRLIEMTASDPHKGLAFNVENACRYSIKWVGRSL